MTSIDAHTPRQSEDEEQDRRRAAVDQARHSSQMEGVQSSPAGRELQEQYVDGEISAEQLVDRTRQMVQARNGRA